MIALTTTILRITIVYQSELELLGIKLSSLKYVFVSAQLTNLGCLTYCSYHRNHISFCAAKYNVFAEAVVLLSHSRVCVVVLAWLNVIIIG